MPKSLLEMAASALENKAEAGEPTPAESSVTGWVDEQQVKRRAEGLFPQQPVEQYSGLPRSSLLGRKVLFVTPDGREFESQEEARGHLLVNFLRDEHTRDFPNSNVGFLPFDWIEENYARVKAALYKVEQET